jgi:hypothetical protein
MKPPLTREVAEGRRVLRPYVGHEEQNPPCPPLLKGANQKNKPPLTREVAGGRRVCALT